MSKWGFKDSTSTVDPWSCEHRDIQTDKQTAEIYCYDCGQILGYAND